MCSSKGKDIIKLELSSDFYTSNVFDGILINSVY